MKVIKYNENLLTGERIEEHVEKPAQAMHNKVTISLFDAETGQKTTEAYTENAMCDMFDAWAYRDVFMRLNNVNSSPNWQWLSALTNTNMPDVFAYISLHSGSEAEMSDPYAIQSPLVGYCGKHDTEATGTSTTKGTYNSVESFMEYDNVNKQIHVHKVYDWPTNAGNGTIQNIYWSAHAAPGYQNLACRKNGSANPFAGYPWLPDKRGNAYSIRDNKAYKINNMLDACYAMRPIEIDTEETFYRKTELNGYYYDIILKRSGTSGTDTFNMQMKVTKYTLTGDINDEWYEELISPIPFLSDLQEAGKLGTRNSTSCIGGFLDEDGWMSIAVQYSSASTSAIFPRVGPGDIIITPNYNNTTICYTMYNVVSQRWLWLPDPSKYVPYSSTYLISTSYGTSSLQYDCNYFCKKLPSGWSLYVKDSSESYLYKITGSEIEKYNSTSRIIHPTMPLCNRLNSSNDYVNYLNYLVPLGAQTRLAAPITKTSLNTMKIQYDFYYKIPITWWNRDHIWDLYPSE